MSEQLAWYSLYKRPTLHVKIIRWTEDQSYAQIGIEQQRSTTELLQVVLDLQEFYFIWRLNILETCNILWKYISEI